MELEEMKNLWNDMSQRMEKQKGLTDQIIIDMTQLKYDKQTNIFRNGEIWGLAIAYAMTGAILYTFNTLDTWYLSACGIIMIIYLLVMPLYSIAGVKRMKKVDLAKSSYKEVLEQFYTGKNRLKQAETISLIASPLLFIASLAIFWKVFAGRDLLRVNLPLPMVVLIVVAFTGAILFNLWAFKKRGQHLRSVKQLLEDSN